MPKRIFPATSFLRCRTTSLLIVSLLAAIVSAAVLSVRVRSAAGLPVIPPANISVAPQANNSDLVQSYGKLPLSFEANEGQVDLKAKFLSHGPGYELFLTETGAVLTLSKPAGSSGN